MKVECLDELVPEPAAQLVALVSKGYGGNLMVHTSRLTHEECGTCGTRHPGRHTLYRTGGHGSEHGVESRRRGVLGGSTALVADSCCDS
jgi:hypothetical protein